MFKRIANIILYIPKKIYHHFVEYETLKIENQQLDAIVLNQQKIFKSIIEACESNACGNYDVKIRKIKELARMFPNPS